MVNEQKKVWPFPIWLIITALVLWITVCALQGEIIDVITLFLMSLIKLVFFITATVIFIVFTINTARLWKQDRFSRNIAIRIIVIALFIISFFIPFDDLYERARFSVLSSSFDNAAQEIMTAETDTDVVSLPAEFSHLSRGGGEVIVFGEGHDRIVLFFSYRGILDSYSVFAYAPNNQAYNNLLQHGDWVQVLAVGDDWYFCVSV